MGSVKLGCRAARWLLAAALGLLALAPAAAAENEIRLDLPVLPAVRQYIDLLPYPAYLALAMENNGIGLAQARRLEVLDGHGVLIRNIIVKFVRRNGPMFSYEATVDWPGFSTEAFRVPVDIDVSDVPGGRVRIALRPPLAKLVSQEIIDRIQLRIQLLADLAAQQKVIAYLDSISAGSREGARGAMFERILIDGYNRGRAGTPAGKEPGESEPLSDQLLLIVTLIIWLVIVPMALLLRRWRHRRPSKPLPDRT